MWASGRTSPQVSSGRSADSALPPGRAVWNVLRSYLSGKRTAAKQIFIPDDGFLALGALHPHERREDPQRLVALLRIRRDGKPLGTLHRSFSSHWLFSRENGYREHGNASQKRGENTDTQDRPSQLRQNCTARWSLCKRGAHGKLLPFAKHGRHEKMVIRAR